MAVDYKALGLRVRAKRKTMKMSQAELAERVDLSVQHISNIENARTKVGLEKLVDISNALDSSVDEFLCESVTKSRVVYDNEIFAILENFSDTEIRMVPDLLRYYESLITKVEKKIKQEHYND